MSCRILSNSASPGLNRLLHINSQRCSGSAVRCVPHRCRCARFAWDRMDSIVCVCAPLDGSTKCSEWLTDRCLKSCRARHEYARYPSVTMVQARAAHAAHVERWGEGWRSSDRSRVRSTGMQ
ncbi:hypothetical protein M513_07714 [Trichuris suis]|uniref:Uncharacterized protein n=1 Tax=Trichuris suis TaxID=68888 RepID=A0A085M263_9BILA|nr:hypothetical protein M513_07714 [Trichuris suis]